MAILLPTNADTGFWSRNASTGSTLNFNNYGAAFFDASDAGPTGATWNNITLAFNGNTSDSAGAVTAGILKGTGTTAPSSGGTVNAVTVRFWHNAGREAWFDLAVPAGGWTWAKVEALHVEFDYLDPDMKVSVYESDGGALLGTATYPLIDSAVGMQLVAASKNDYILLLAFGDDNVETWTTPVTFTEFFQVNDTGGDDASIGAWYVKIDDVGSAVGLAGAVVLTRSAGEEQVGVIMVVQGADPTTFEDVAFASGSHFNSHQNTNAPDPSSITTNTDGAVVIVMTGNRSDAGHLNSSSGVPNTFDVDAPSGYTIEADFNPSVPNGTDAEGAPGRLEQGTGNGDAQMTWAHQTVATAGVENPGAYANFLSTRDHKVITFAIRPAIAAVRPPFPRRQLTTVRM